MRKHVTRKALVAAFISVVALFAVAAVALALTDGPEESDDHQDGNGTSHESTVHYTRQLVPWIARVDKVHFGGRGEDLSDEPFQCCGEWRRDATEYRRWTGTKWKLVKTVSNGGYHVGDQSLSYYNLNNDVTLEGGAYVRQHLRYRNTITWPVMGTYDFPGRWNKHFLE